MYNGNRMKKGGRVNEKAYEISYNLFIDYVFVSTAC